MVGRSRRKIIIVGDSKAVTLPPEWVKLLKCREVELIYDDILLIIPNRERAEKIADELIKKAVENITSET